mmetsp:Transcript_28366/g.69884  ORF Transcript_28366/g.69884 Transcript_28366/m.69884 type:complete len:165 (-) Transcript_28366:679-1173(-)
MSVLSAAAVGSRVAPASGFRQACRGTELVSRVAVTPVRRQQTASSPSALFTGLVQGTAEVVSFDNVGDFARLKLQFPPSTLRGILIGASVSCNGTCLTVVETDGDTVACFDLIVETLRATNLGELVPGSSVNYERSARGLPHLHYESSTFLAQVKLPLRPCDFV